MSSPGRAVLRTETRLFLREPGALFWIIAFPTVLVVILGLIPSFRDPVEEYGGQSVIGLYVPIAVLLAMIVAAITAVPVVIVGYREQQVLRRIATTPAQPAHLLGAQFIIHGVAVAISAALAIVVGRVAFGVALPAQPLGYALIMLLTFAALLALGGIIAGVAPNTRLASTFGTILFFPLMFTAGVWIPVQAMPGILGEIVELTPLGAAAVAMDSTTLGQWPATVHVLVLVAWTIGLGLLAIRFFRWE
jgi:ABC-2 type transport system permease protein